MYLNGPVAESRTDDREPSLARTDPAGTDRATRWNPDPAAITTGSGNEETHPSLRIRHRARSGVEST